MATLATFYRAATLEVRHNRGSPGSPPKFAETLTLAENLEFGSFNEFVGGELWFLLLFDIMTENWTSEKNIFSLLVFL